MKVAMIALAAAATLTVAAPAFAAHAQDRYYNDEGQQEQQQTYYNSGLSEHCQQVLNRPAMWGSKEVTFCQNSL
jgi:hypothetical protein